MSWSADMPDRRGAADKVSWKAYVDRVFEEHHRQTTNTMAAMDVRLEERQTFLDERLKSAEAHYERIFAEKQRTSEIVIKERGKAAQSLRDELHRATDQAEREREKAAQALATTLHQSIKEGDERLREHIQNQVQQVQAALEGVEGRAVLRHNGTGTQLEDRFRYTEIAVAKAEQATEKRFSSVNAFREQLAEQATQFVLREVADAQFLELRKALANNTTRLDLIQGNSQGTTATMGQIVAIVGVIAAIAAILIGAYT